MREREGEGCCTQELTTGFTHFGRYHFHVVIHLKGFPRLRVVLLAKRNNVPTHFGQAVLLDESAYFNVIHAVLDRTIGWGLVTESVPMVKPGIALATLIVDTVSIFNLHFFFFLRTPAMGSPTSGFSIYYYFIAQGRQARMGRPGSVQPLEMDRKNGVKVVSNRRKRPSS